MNHIYKSIFNKALGVFTAVPEFASAHGKGSERTVVGRVAKGTAGFAASALAISVGLALTSTSAVAGPGIYINDGTDNGCIAYIDTHNSYVGIFGIGSTINVNNSMVKPGYTIPPDSYWGLDKMKPCLSSTGANATEHRSTQTNRTLFYGNNPTASVKDNGAKNLTLGGRLDVNSGIIGVGDRGTNGVGATNSIRMGTGTTLDDTNKHTNAIAIGVNTATTAEGAVAISAEAKARTSYSIAIGRNATASGDMFSPSNETGSAIAIGRNSLSNFIGAVALGNGATVSPAKSGGNTTDGIAIGTKALVDSYRGMAIGANSQAKGSQSIVLANNVPGAKVSTASGTRSQVYGVESEVSGSNSVAMGSTNTVASNYAYAIGNNINVAAGADDSLVFGRSANVKGQDQISIGHNAGADAVATAKNAYGIALGLNAGRYQQGGQDNYAIGQNAGQYVNGTHSVALGLNAGSHIEGDGNFAAADGAGNYIKGRNNIAIGNNAGSGAAGAIVEADRTISVGTRTQARGDNAVAIGTDSKALAVDATAVGQAAQASAEKTVAVGQGAKATERFTVAMGHNATASHENSVALGTNSETADVHTGDYTLSTSYTAEGLPNAANGTVSVGSKGKERQIQNVAAGVISKTSTDAINGSQLYATNNYLSNLAGGVKNVLGGNAAVDNAGNVTMSNIGGTGENTVDGAIKNLKTAIDSKADTTASVTSENAADIKVEKEAQVGNITNYKLSLGDDAKAKLAKAATALQTVEGDSNITATKDPADPTKVKLALKRDLTADSVTLGNTTGDQAVVNKDGLTIDNGPSVKKDGINAGNKKITGVADGNVALGSTDAVNGGQLAEVKSKADSAVQNVVSANPTALTVTKAGDTVTLTPNFIAGDLVNPATGEVNTPAADDAGKLVTAGTVAKALAETHFVVDTKATTGGELDGASQANQKIKSSNKVTLQAGKNLKAKQTNGTDGAQVEFSLKDSISLTQVTAGTGDNQVVLGKDGVQVGGNTYINKDGINAAGKAISNVANGNVAAYSKDAVNGGQLHDTAKSMADVIGGGATVKDGKVVAGQNGIGNTGQNTVHGAIAAINQNTANNFNQIRGDLRKMDRDLRGSIAGTLATAGLPQAFSPGKSMVAAAAGTYRGQSGLAVGVSRISDNGKVILKVTGNTNSRGDFGGTIGAGYQW